MEDMLEKELWKPDNFKEYKTKKDAEMRVKMAEGGRSHPPPPPVVILFYNLNDMKMTSKILALCF